ncbi:hypothetical protein GS610_06685 [Ruegeria sp. HKCCD6228]|nr:hypothetical protein [Ruegeria sp. HKCCD6228]
MQYYTSELAACVNFEAGSGVPEISDYEVFAKYFEVSLLSSFLEEVLELEVKGLLHTKGPAEKIACRELEAIFTDCDIPGIRKIDDFSDARRLCKKLLDIFLMRDYDYSGKFVRKTIQAFSIGRLVRFIRELGVAALASPQLKSGKPLQLYILVDDCESLSSEQQKALNTYIRQTEGEAKWVVSYLSGQFNSVDTYLPNTSLTEADRDIVGLSGMGDADFSKFCEQVADIRLKSFVSQNTSKLLNDEKSFSFQRFGSFSYNHLVELSLKSSQSRPVRDFKDAVSDTKNGLQSVISKALWKSFHCERGDMPYVEHLVIKELKIDLNQYPSKEDQQTLLKVIARKQVAAFIYICEMLNRRPILAGRNVVYLFADTTIRDFLDLMASMWDEMPREGSSTSDVPETLANRARYFLNSKTVIPVSRQNAAIRKASLSKAQSVEALLSSTEPHIAHFVRGIGYLTHELHGLTDRPRALSTPERGVFKTNVDEVDALRDSNSIKGSFLKLLCRMERDGFIRILDLPAPGSPFVRFRLHRRLCPQFECSPRGGYEMVQFSARDALDLLDWKPENDERKWAENWMRDKGSQSEFYFGGAQ